MSLLDLLYDHNIWEEFLQSKLNNSYLPSKVIEECKVFIENKKYEKIVKYIIAEKYIFSIPNKIIISKMSKNKKRIVYNYNEEETYVLKVLSYLLYKYDYMFTPNLYSFRKNIGVKKAIYDIMYNKIINKMYGYKLDISNYFNSIPTSQLLLNLKKDLQDEKLYNLFEKILTNQYVNYNGTISLEINKGIMAGIPISAFLANYYLKNLDKYFYENNILYARYADDIIVFDGDLYNLNKHIEFIRNYIKSKGLTINKEKEQFYNIGDKLSFLGFSYHKGIIDLSDNTKRKIKGKIRRTARGIRRWMLKNNVTYEITLKAMNRKFNRKFYGKQENDLTWKYWFFPIINTSASLKEIDLYMQSYERYIITGCHNKKNFDKVPYSFLKKCNYKPLVYEYYKDKKSKNIRNY